MNEPKQLSQPLPRTMEPMTSEQARDLVSRYLKSFPTLNLASPEVYLLELAVLFAGYPWWAGAGAIEVAKDTFKFPPTRAELRPLLEDQVRYVRRADEQLGKGDFSVLTVQPRGKRPTYNELKEKYGDNWGIKNEPMHPKPKPKPLPSWAEVMEYYRANPKRWAALFADDPDAAVDAVEREAWQKKQEQSP